MSQFPLKIQFETGTRIQGSMNYFFWELSVVAYWMILFHTDHYNLAIKCSIISSRRYFFYILMCISKFNKNEENESSDNCHWLQLLVGRFLWQTPLIIVLVWGHVGEIPLCSLWSRSGLIILLHQGRWMITINAFPSPLGHWRMKLLVIC